MSESNTCILKLPVFFSDEGFLISFRVKEIDFRIDGNALVIMIPLVAILISHFILFPF